MTKVRIEFMKNYDYEYSLNTIYEYNSSEIDHLKTKLELQKNYIVGFYN